MAERWSLDGRVEGDLPDVDQALNGLGQRELGDLRVTELLQPVEVLAARLEVEQHLDDLLTGHLVDVLVGDLLESEHRALRRRVAHRRHLLHLLGRCIGTEPIYSLYNLCIHMSIFLTKPIYAVK